jgi:2-dehydro-3-deoxyphosphooctonate aldolase (KDO 8-P synthase)
MTYLVDIAPGVELGGDVPLLIAGPCVVESYELTYQTAERLKTITAQLGIPFVFKASYDKANRTSSNSFRSIGFENALEVLWRVKQELGVPLLTDIHEVDQVERVAEVVDVLQIPAFLCRQTDLIAVAGRTGRAVNIKHGQFMAPEDMQYAVAKVREEGNDRVFLTERGISFGYHNLVVDMRALPIMRRYSPVVFDATHSIQMPGGGKGVSSGQREFAPYLARAAAGVGVDGFFVETHPHPENALSDGPNMIPLDEMPQFLESILVVWRASKPFVAALP